MPVSLFENKPECCPFGHRLWPGKAQVSWTPCICQPAREAAGRGRGMGHVRVTCNRCHDQFRQTVFYEPPHDSGHRPLTGWVTGPDPSPERVGDDGQGNGYRSGPVWRGDADHADDLLGRVRVISSAVCAPPPPPRPGWRRPRRPPVADPPDGQVAASDATLPYGDLVRRG